MKRLEALLNQEHKDLKKWIRGKIPKHFKRLSVDEDKAIELAIEGAAQLRANFPPKRNEEGEVEYEGIMPFFCQALIAGAILSGEYDDITICTPSQYGKLIADDVPVLTSEGWKNHGDLEVGDEVIAPNGEFVKVVYVHPKQMTDRIVRFSNGDEIECHHNHLWAVYDRNSHIDRVMDTLSIQKRLKAGERSPFMLPKREAVEGEEKNLSVPPYVMGVWLGDGYTTKGQICGHPDDIAVLDKCREFYPDGSEWVHKTTGVITRSYIGLANDLSAYGMCYQSRSVEKHIPDEYLTASIDQRLELLAGLIDTDGYLYQDDGRFYFTTADKALKDSFEALISTFGWRVSTIAVEPKMSSSGIQGKKEYYRIGFNPDMDIPCVLERKRPTRFAKQRRISIESVMECEPHQGNCITVEGGLYCVGQHLIPTHNSWLMGHVGLIKASRGDKTYIAGADAGDTDIIMNNVIGAVLEAHEEVQLRLNGVKKNDLTRLASALNKQKINFVDAGSLETISLGETYAGIKGNRAVGRGGDYIVDEAARCSSESLAELGRADFANVDGRKCQTVFISNPHAPGEFYDRLTAEDAPRTFVLWMDALTAVEEGRFTREQVLTSKFAKNKSRRTVYLMCELETSGQGMFDEPLVEEGIGDTFFLGIDSAYKGKDNIEVCLGSIKGMKLYVNEILTMNKSNWIDGVTSKEIIDDISRICSKYHVRCICVDEGWGVWLKEGLVARSLPARGINFAHSATNERVKAGFYSAVNAYNVRAEMHLDLQELIERKRIAFNAEAYEKVKDTLPHVISERKGRKIQIRPKQELKAIIGRSPDELDSVLLMVHAFVLYAGGDLSEEYITDEQGRTA